VMINNSTRGMSSQSTNTIKHQLSVLFHYKANIIIS